MIRFQTVKSEPFANAELGDFTVTAESSNKF